MYPPQGHIDQAATHAPHCRCTQGGFFEFVALPLTHALTTAFPNASPIMDCFVSSTPRYECVARLGRRSLGSIVRRRLLRPHYPICVEPSLSRTLPFCPLLRPIQHINALPYLNPGFASYLATYLCLLRSQTMSIGRRLRPQLRSRRRAQRSSRSLPRSVTPPSSSSSLLGQDARVLTGCGMSE